MSAERMQYTQQVLEDIKAIAENREDDIKLPLRVLKRAQPKAYKNAYERSLRKAYRKTDKYKACQKAYRRSLSELRKKHPNDFQKLLVMYQNEI